MDQSEKQKILEEYMRTPQGRAKIVASMREPIMLRVRFRSLALPESRVVQIKGAPRTIEGSMLGIEIDPKDPAALVRDVERGLTQVVDNLTAGLDAHVLELLREKCPPTKSEVPEGLGNVLLNTETYTDMIRTRSAKRDGNPSVLGGSFKVRGAHVRTHSGIEPGVVFGVGPEHHSVPSALGMCELTLRTWDASTGSPSGRHLRTFGIGAELTVRVDEVDHPEVMAYLWQPPAVH